jgi:benzoyl-CoA 2,3-dioxygenase component A
MSATETKSGAVQQHLIDPAICIRCNTCEETCPIGAIEHDSRNYVVKFDVCEQCKACIAPCPTGAIDSWRSVAADHAYAIADQYKWDELPGAATAAVASSIAEAPVLSASAGTAESQVPLDVQKITAIASSAQEGAAVPPWSASHPYINVYSTIAPAIATVSGNLRLTAEDASSDIRHIVLDFGVVPFPVLEGQSIGILPPGVDTNGKPYHVRLYSIASPREGERPRYNNVALTVKRVAEDHEGVPVQGICSNYLCDLKKGDQVNVVGPFGSSFLMPNHPGSSLMMICTGTGSAPMRAMTERRRRRRDQNEGGDLLLFFGSRTPEELPYFGPLKSLPPDFIDINLAFSRLPETPKVYVQDLIRKRADRVAKMLRDDNSYIYICGLKGMEAGVIEAFRDVACAHDLNWDELKPQLLRKGRLHIETY